MLHVRRHVVDMTPASAELAASGQSRHLTTLTWLQVQRVAGNFHVTVSMEDFFMLEETQAREHVIDMGHMHLPAEEPKAVSFRYTLRK